jgi:hypothetical protein
LRMINRSYLLVDLNPLMEGTIFQKLQKNKK